jgi:hypothetical protein
MTAKGNVIFDFLDVSGKRLNDRMDVSLSHTVLADSHQKKDFKPSKRLKFTDLEAAEGGTYQVIAYPMRHRPVSRFVESRKGKQSRRASYFRLIRKGSPLSSFQDSTSWVMTCNRSSPTRWSKATRTRKVQTSTGRWTLCAEQAC